MKLLKKRISSTQTYLLTTDGHSPGMLPNRCTRHYLGNRKQLMPLLLDKVAAMTSFREDTQTVMRIMTMRMMTMKMKAGMKMATCFVLVFNGGVRVAG